MTWLAVGLWIMLKLTAQANELRSWDLRPAAIILQILPGLILLFGVVCLFVVKRWRLAILLGTMLLALGLGFMVLFGQGMAEVAQVQTSPKQYHRTRIKYYSESELDDHFPDQIPTEAKNVRFSFLPGFLMGGSHLYLQYETNPEALAKMRALAEKHRNPVCNLAGFIADVPEINQFHRPFDLASKPFVDRLGKDFDVYFFDKDFPEMKQDEWVWNHGQSHGIAISVQRKEVLFWAEDW
ncbi:MAG: hypothetical protein V4599_15165 [Verrucomicrobiota bacterium]